MASDFRVRCGNRSILTGSGTLLTMEAATPVVTSETGTPPFNAKNQWTGASFDAAGNQETTFGAGTEARSAKFVFDAENRVATATVTNGVGAVSYGYDGDGRRVTSTVGGATTTFVYDAFGSLVAEYSNAAASSAGCTSCLLTSDHLGSTRVVWDAATGAVKRLYDYSPFGEEVNATLRADDARYPARMYPLGTRNEVTQMFTGKERDTETALDFFGARYFSSAQGRFSSPDPLLSSGRPWAPQSWNRYAYALNNPVRYTDPTGLYEWDATLGGGCTDKALKGGSCEGFTKAQGKDVVNERKNIRSGLKLLDNSKDPSLRAVGGAIGSEGRDNGVTISMKKLPEGVSAQVASNLPLKIDENGNPILTRISHQ